MRMLMLVPSTAIRGPLPKHLPVLVDALRALGVEVRTELWGRRADYESRSAKLVRQPSDIARILGVLRRHRFDVLLVNTSHEITSMARDLPLLLAATASPVKKVLHFHGGHSHLLCAPRHRFFKAASASLLAMSDGIFVHSAEEERALRAFRPDRTVRATRYAVAAEPVRRRGMDPSGATPIILFASRLIEEKGLFDTIEAFALVRERTDCRLVVAGSGRDEVAAARRAEALGVASDVLFTGYLTGEDLARTYASADVFILPTYWVEGFPLALAEALAAGLPVVTTRARAISDELVDGVNALFVPPRAPAALADSLERLLGDSALRAHMRDANREKTREFAPDTVARAYLRSLSEILIQR